MNMISKELIQQLRELESGVTPGEWKGEGYHIFSGEFKAFTSCRSWTDARFLALLRNNATALLDEIERLQGEIEFLKEEAYGKSK